LKFNNPNLRLIYLKNAKFTAKGILYIAIPIAFLMIVNTYILDFHFVINYIIVFITSTIGSFVTKDMEDGKLAGFYGSSLALIIWLGRSVFSTPLVYIVMSIFTLYNIIALSLLELAMELLLIYILYNLKLLSLQIVLIIMFIVGYIGPQALLISVEWGYMVTWESVIHLFLIFLLEVIVVIIISTISGLFGGWIGKNWLVKHQVNEFRVITDNT
jgi:hypothetical protein